MMSRNYTAHPRIYHSAEFRKAVTARLDYWNTEQPGWATKKLMPLLRNEGLEVSRELQTNIGICWLRGTSRSQWTARLAGLTT